MEKRKPIILISAIAVIIVTAVLLIVLRDGEESDSSIKSVEVFSAPFLNVDPHLVDSVMATMSDEDKLKSILVVESLEDTAHYNNLFKKGFSNFQLRLDQLPLLASLDTLDTSGAVFTILHVGPEYSADKLVRVSEAIEIEFEQDLRRLVQRYGVNYLQYHMPPDILKDSAECLTAITYSKLWADKYAFELIDSILRDSVLVGISLPESLDSAWLKTQKKMLGRIIDRGICGISLKEFKRNVHNVNDYKGLVIGNNDSLSVLQRFIQADLIKTNDPEFVLNRLKKHLELEDITLEQVDQKVKRYLMAKLWSKKKHKAHHTQEERYFKVRFAYYQHQIERAGIAVLKNKRLPLTGHPDRMLIVRFGKSAGHVVNGIQNYVDPAARAYNSIEELGKAKAQLSSGSPIVIVLNDYLISEKDSLGLETLKELISEKVIVFVNVGNQQNLDKLDFAENLIQMDTASNRALNRLGQALMGGISLAGNYCVGSEIKTFSTAKIRVGYSSPLEVGCDPLELSNVSWVAQEGISSRAFPGCQVFATYKGEVLINESYGYLTYRKQTKVTNEHLYDLASVTKVAATTLVAMKMMEHEKFKLHDSLQHYLPDTLAQYLFRGRSTLRHITWFELLTHTSGLPAGFPYINYVQYQDSITGRYDRYYCDMADDSMYCMQVAENYYLERSYADSIWIKMNQLWLHEDKAYLYSDVNFLLLYKLFTGMLVRDDDLLDVDKEELEDVTFNHFDEYVNQTFYRPLKLDRTCFLPRRYFEKEEIAPTEDDNYWRKQVVHGYVHDPTAALFGGIAGNAGLFSTAQEMGVLFTMLLQGGQYAGETYIPSEIVSQFIRRQPGSHRGLGFNKPVGGGMYGIAEQASLETFGHTGFTGNSIWADPTNEVLYILLSNRSHPDAHNPKILRLGTRMRIQQHVYKSIARPNWLEPTISSTTLAAE